MVGVESRKSVVLVLTPVGRDAATVAGLIQRTGLRPVICNTVLQLVDNLDRIIEVVLVAEEALYGNNVLVLEDWVRRQPPWSDQPFVVLTNHNEGPKFAAFRRELVMRLRNVGFLERPLQALTLQATVLSAERARRRQYEIRAHLEAQRGAAVELERLVSERTAELKRANSKLREEIAGRERAQAALIQAQKIEALGQLVGGVAHDFNNLLTAVIGNLDLLSKKLGEDARLQRLLNGAMEGARRGATLTQRLLAFARKQELKAQVTDVRSLLEDMMSLLHRSVGPMIRVELEVEGAVPAVDVDPNQLEMALLNLALNGRDAMVSGGVLAIGLTMQNVDDENQLGIQPGPIRDAFSTRHRRGNERRNLGQSRGALLFNEGSRQGHGFGSIHGVWYGATIRRRSAPRKRPVNAEQPLDYGCQLPGESRSPSGSTPSVVTQAAARATILFVDDDLLIAGSTVALLEDLGHEVVEVHSAREALQLLEGGLAADLLITDHAMPGMTGIELACGPVAGTRPIEPVAWTDSASP